MKALRTISGLIVCAVGLTIIALLEYANFGLSDGPGYDFIYKTAFSSGTALVWATLSSVLSLLLGGIFIAAGCYIITTRNK